MDGLSDYKKELSHYKWMHDEEIKDMEFELDQRERVKNILNSIDPESSAAVALRKTISLIEDRIRKAKKEYKKKYGSTMVILK